MRILLNLLAVAFIVISYNSIAQKCGTPPMDSSTFVNQLHYGNSAFLDEITEITRSAIDRKKNVKADIGYESSGPLFNIPVKVWAYHDINGNFGLTETTILDIIDIVNIIFEENNTNIQFYLKCSIENLNTTYYEVKGGNDFDYILSHNRDPKALNLHFVHSMYNGGGRARFPGSSEQFSLALQKINNSDIQTAALLAHEIGHTLGLLHTHESTRTNHTNNGDVGTKCYQESVSRSKRNEFSEGCGPHTIGKLKCEINGDGLCDTEASPRDLRNDMSGCTYTGTEKDEWNYTFTPPVRNYMSYTKDNCDIEFTEDQIALMHISLHLYFDDVPGSFQGNPYYNRNILIVEGQTLNSETDAFASSEKIIAAKNNSYEAKSGSDVEFIAQNSIQLKPGFKAVTGSNFIGKVQSITNCDIITTDAPTINSRVANTSNSKAYYYSAMEEFNIGSELERSIRKAEQYQKDWKASVATPNVISDQINIYPNPSSGIFEISSQVDVKEVSVYDQSGKNVYLNKGNLKKINLMDLSPNIYFIKIVTESSTEYKKIILE